MTGLSRQRVHVDAPAVPAARAALHAALPTDLVAEYLALSIDCDSVVTRADIKSADVRARHGNALIIRFKLATCGFESPLLTALLETDPR